MGNRKKPDINIIAYAYVGVGISGGDRILTEYVKRWAKNGHIVNIFTSEEGFELFKRCDLHQLENIKFEIWSSSLLNKFGLIPAYIFRTIKACYIVAKTSYDTERNIIYSSSDFWPDPIPGFLMSRKIRGSRWVATFYLFTPNPLSKESPYKGVKFLKGLLYYLSQRPTYWLIKRYADMVFVTNDLDREKFICERLPPEKVIAVRGGVDLKTSNSIPTPEYKKYDAIFVGRFVPHKGILELFDIWDYVCGHKKDAKLAILGSGELEKQVRAKRIQTHLEDNVDLLGFVDGIEKIEIIKTSKIVLHPSVCDSGGMAPCEAMACGLPGVGFDLPALRTYYPKGMLKTPCYDVKVFAENILKLLENKELYEETKKQAVEWAQEWDWDKRAEEILNKICGE